MPDSRLSSALVTTVIAALVLLVPAPPPALASATMRDDDGVRDTSIHVDAGGDRAVKRLVVPTGALRHATSAKLWVYAEADACGAPSASHRLTVNDATVTEFDPCDLWGVAAYSWASFDVPLSALRAGAVNSFQISESGGLVGEGDPANRNAFYGVDSTNDFGRSDLFQSDNYLVGIGTEIPGELMWYLDVPAPVLVRDDDDERDSLLDLDYLDDVAEKRLVMPSGALSTASSATLWIYAQADACGLTGASQRLRANNTTVTDFNPCDVWSSAGFGWATFDVPLTMLAQGATNSFTITEVAGSSGDRNALYGVDTDSNFGRSTIRQNWGDRPGELMWYLELAPLPAPDTTRPTCSLGRGGFDPLVISGIGGFCSDDLSGIDLVTVTYNSDGVGLSSSATAQLECNATGTACYWRANPPDPGPVVMRVTATDRAGNSSVPAEKFILYV